MPQSGTTTLSMDNSSISPLKLELANSISHGIGLLFGIVAIPILIALAASHGHIEGIVGSSIFGFSFLLLYTSSTLHHGLHHPQAKHTMLVLDHISIFFLIAGSYTPFLLIYLLNATGITVLSCLWGFAVIGIVLQIYFFEQLEEISYIIYLLMGISVVFIGPTVLETIPENCLIMLGIGMGLYLIGLVFYLWKRIPYHHAIWHVFVLAASICHYVAVLLAV